MQAVVAVIGYDASPSTRIPSRFLAPSTHHSYHSTFFLRLFTNMYTFSLGAHFWGIYMTRGMSVDFLTKGISLSRSQVHIPCLERGNLVFW